MVAEDKGNPNQAIVLRGVTKAFGSMHAVNNVSLTIEEGKIHSIIGPNGAGKTTLFNLVSGNIPCTAGKIFLFGRDITQTPSYERARLGLGRSFQITNLFHELTVLESLNLAMAPKVLSFHSFRFARRETTGALALCEQFGLGDKWKINVKNLSHGEQRQVEVILALALQPTKVLLLDEPTAGLSPAETSQMLNMIHKTRKGITVVLVEHDLDVVFELSDKITVLQEGQVLSEGTGEEIKKDPAVQKAYLGTF